MRGRSEGPRASQGLAKYRPNMGLACARSVLAAVAILARLFELGLAATVLLALTLARLKAAMGLVDDIDPAFAPNDAIVAVATAQRL
jgi:hypothetical protein